MQLLRPGISPKYLFSLLMVSLMLTVVSTPSSASLADDIEEANEGSSGGEVGPQSEVDTANVDLNELTELLNVLNSQVKGAEAVTTKLEAERKSLEGQATTFESDILDIQTEIDALEAELAERSIESFKGSGSLSILSDSDPSDSLRKDGLLASVVRSELEVAEGLRQAKVELAATAVSQDELTEKLDLEAEQNVESLQKYESARAAFVEVAVEAEKRAEQTLFEAEGLEGVDDAKAEELRTSVAALQQQVSLALADQLEKELAEAAANPDKEYVPDGTFPAEADLADVGNGITVHKDIAGRVTLMLQAAAADGVLLQSINGTGGYRSNARQIELRKQHCGTSDFAIYEMRSGLCNPPTATPGNSQHEQGRAIDFSNSSGAISKGSPEFVWLTQNAETYGFFNLPSESWHWSVDGN